MALVLVGGFSLNIVTGRSTFASPPRFHVHAFIFMGWLAIFLTQVTLADNGSLALHRRLGWIAAVWVPLMLISGVYMTVADARSGRIPPVFEPAAFLIMDWLAVFGFAGMVTAAIMRRRQTQWHRRLMLCSMAMILGPGFGRLLPMPMLIPWTVLAANAPGLLFPLAGAIRDWRADGRVHPAWWWGIGAMLAMLFAMQVLPHTSLGLDLYAWVTSGSDKALPPLDFPMLSHAMPH
ncbi:MAG: hypothetical protein JSS25_02405 [Proteobacteria bacterium]|nr:hypothetical protein [Pseudomonadota bacterium]